ncbi:unnamed protein product, partial [Prorocentrum cordatum]
PPRGLPAPPPPRGPAWGPEMPLGSSASAPALGAGPGPGSASATRTPQVATQRGTPAPGQYAWQDDALRKKPPTTMISPDRKNVDPYVSGAWVPATTGSQTGQAAPGEYFRDPYMPKGPLGVSRLPGRNGAPKSLEFSFGKNSARMPEVAKPDTMRILNTSFHLSETSSLPVSRKLPTWSVYGKDRSNLPWGLPTWNADTQGKSYQVPGPGSYEIDRRASWKPRTRALCTFGGRIGDLGKTAFLRTR